MTRDQLKEIYPDFTDEQLTKLLNMHHAEMKKAKADEAAPLNEQIAQYEADLAELKAQIEELSNQNLDEGAKVDKALQEAETAKAKYETAFSRLEVEKMFVSAGIAEEDYKGMLDSVVTADLKASKKTAEQILTVLESQKSSIEAKVKEDLMRSNPNPDDNKGSGEGKGEESNRELTSAEQVVQSLAKAKAASSKSQQDARAYYGIGGNTE